MNFIHEPRSPGLLRRVRQDYRELRFVGAPRGSALRIAWRWERNRRGM